jgi:hypothetical protein
MNISRKTTPWETRLLDSMTLLNPRLWWGVLKIVNDFMPLEIGLLVEAFVRLLLPVLLLTMLSSSSQAATTAALCSLASPWSIGSVARVLPHITKRATVMWTWKELRCPALPEAIVCLEERIACNRAYRTRRYDIYLPNDNQQDSPNNDASDKPNKAVLILPGALVEHAGYSELAARLSDAGLLVVVLSLEPMRLASPLVSRTDVGSMRKLLKRIKKDHPQHEEWILAGHSFGANRVVELLSSTSSRQLPFQKFVVWGQPNFRSLLKRTKENDGMKILAIQGELDPLRAMAGNPEKDLEDMLSSFPNSREVMLLGGNHCQFGTYAVVAPKKGPHWSQNDVATISRQEQQDQVGNLTVKFCFDA